MLWECTTSQPGVVFVMRNNCAEVHCAEQNAREQHEPTAVELTLLLVQLLVQDALRLSFLRMVTLQGLHIVFSWEWEPPTIN